MTYVSKNNNLKIKIGTRLVHKEQKSDPKVLQILQHLTNVKKFTLVDHKIDKIKKQNQTGNS